MADRKPELLQGTLDLLILKTLDLGPLHGWGVAKHIEQLSREVLSIGQGSLYPALYRLEDRGLVRSQWGQSETGRRVKLYELTERGGKALGAERENWRSLSAAVDRVLEAT